MAKCCIILVEVIDPLSCLQLFLERFFNNPWQRAPILVQSIAHFDHVLVEKCFELLTNSEANKSHMEASHSSFETNLVARLLNNYFAAFVLLVGVVKLGDLEQQPKHLPIELLFQVRPQEIAHPNFATNHNKGKQVPERRSVVFNSLLWLINKSLQMCQQTFFSFRHQFD